MKIAFATIYDARDVRRGSGWPYYLSQELERQGQTVHYVGPLDPDFPRATRLARAFSKRILKKRYRSYQDPFIARRLGQEVGRRLKDIDYDVLLTNDYAIAGYTQVDRPVVLWTDAIFPRAYAEHTNPRLDGLAAPSVYFSQHVNRVGLEAADLCVFPAQSTVDEVTEQYGVPSEKVTLIPFGANLPPSLLEDDPARDFAAVRAKGHIDILFVGKDWQRKGWPIAQETVARLRDAGIDAVIHVVGCEPPTDLPEEAVAVYGLLDRTVAAERDQLLDLYRRCDVFLMPSEAEGYGIVYAEAAAFGLPSLAYRTVGVETAVRHGKSGVLLDRSGGANAFAKVILSWFEDRDAYDTLAAGARQHYLEEANWPTAIRTFIERVQA